MIGAPIATARMPGDKVIPLLLLDSVAELGRMELGVVSAISPLFVKLAADVAPIVDVIVLSQVVANVVVCTFARMVAVYVSV